MATALNKCARAPTRTIPHPSFARNALEFGGDAYASRHNETGAFLLASLTKTHHKQAVVSRFADFSECFRENTVSLSPRLSYLRGTHYLARSFESAMAIVGIAGQKVPAKLGLGLKLSERGIQSFE